jgi:hypothetical protein
MLPGQLVMTGGWPSFTVTVKVQVEALPQAFTAVHVTGVEPAAKVEPDAGMQLTGIGPVQQADVAVAGG